MSSQPTTVNKIIRDGSRLFLNHTQGRELLSKLVSQRQIGEFTDVVVEVERREFPCHRAVLATTPYFKTMFSSNLAESRSKVILHGIDSSSFFKILEFLYTGEIFICKDDVQDILQTAHNLQVNKALPYCCEYIQDNLCPSNCLDVMRLADMYGLSDLKRSARNMAAINFLAVTQEGLTKITATRKKRLLGTQAQLAGDSRRRRFQNYTQGRELFAELTSQRKTGEFTDVVVQVGDREFPCHRAVLATTTYFKTMLSSNLAESTSKVIQLHGIDSSSFSKVLDFLYTGEIFICKNDVQDILQTAHMLLVNKILPHCCEFIQGHLCLSNCLSVIRLADMYGLSDLKKRSRNMAVINFLDVTQGEEFLSLSVQELLDLDLLGAGINEDDVIEAVIRWIDSAPEENREIAILKILQETPVKVSMVRKLLVALPCESAECLARFTTDREKQLLDTQLELAEKAKSSPDREISEDLAIIVGGWKAARKPHFHDKHPVNIQPKPLQSIICLDPDTQQCYHITDLPMPVSGYMSVASAGGYLYVTGGREQHTIPSRQAFRYEFPTDSWLRLPNMPRGMAEHHSVVVDGKLFVVDSDAKATPLWVMDCYDPDKEAWIKVHLGYPVMQPIKHTLTALGNNKVVLIEVSKLKVPYTYTKVSNMMKMSRSGNDHSLALKSDLVPSQIGMQNLCVHAFDVKRNSMRCADTPVNTSFKNVDIVTTTVNDKLYIRTGYTMSSDLYIFDAEKNTLGLHSDMDVQGNFGLLRAVGDPENSYRYKDRQNGIVDTISHSEFGSYHRERQTPLPFALFGHSFLQTQKSRIGWHCRDLAVVEMQESDCKRTEGSVPESA
uniref:BTB domain-containing protein n=1 Tax=Branchiostoma floridae TaxID=7739 RepID=C3ZTF8_BRAFL|eukprot:XP_002588194.1 hypothetical protein BRAFLDRAFT_68836 [Branchiostoma floridae]